jgi:dTMP kinase
MTGFKHLLSGTLVVVEGIDGSGKSTLVREIASETGFVLTREPTSGPHGTHLREAFAAGIRLPVEEERRLFELDRRAHVARVLGPALARGDCVICDRSYYSTAAYQGGDPDDVRRVVRENEAFAPRPDAVLFLDLDPDIALAGILARGEAPTAPETYVALRDCAAGYEAIWADEELMRGVSLVRLDARMPMNEIAETARCAIAIALSGVQRRRS